MKYVSRSPPPDDINVSPEHPLKEAVVLVSGLGAVFALVATVLFFLTDLVILLVPAETEARLFESWSPEGLVEIDTGDSRTQATRELLARLAAGMPASPYTFRLGVMENDTPNALAMPGGLVVVTTGLLDRMATENELAFVLGHELGHFHHRDHLRGIGRGIALGVLVGAIAGSDGAGLGLKVADVTLRGFNRRQERAADRYGLEFVHVAYGHVNDAWRFFAGLVEEGQTPGNAMIYLSTHPYAGDRIRDIRIHARDEGWSLAGDPVPLRWHQNREE